MKRDGSWHAIRVKVNAPGAHVRYRSGYYAPRDFQHLEKEDRDKQLADAMRSESPEVDLPIAVETSMFRLSDQQVYVPISAKLSSSALDWAQKHDRREAAFDFAAEVLAVPSGQSVAQLRDTITVHLDEQRFQQVNRSNLVYQGGVVLAPGSYRLKFLARENESGKIGTFEQALTVPQRSAARMSLSSVLLSSQLVPVAKSSEVQTRGQGTRAQIAASPLEMEGEKIVPERHALFHPAADALRFLPGVLSGKDGQSRRIRSQHAPRRAGVLSRRRAGERHASARAHRRRREDAHGVLSHQPAARQITFGTLHRAGRRHRRRHAAIRFWPRLPRARASACVAESYRRAASRDQCAHTGVPPVTIVRN